jgi:hypothetical protein
MLGPMIGTMPGLRLAKAVAAYRLIFDECPDSIEDLKSPRVKGGDPEGSEGEFDEFLDGFEGLWFTESPPGYCVVDYVQIRQQLTSESESRDGDWAPPVLPYRGLIRLGPPKREGESLRLELAMELFEISPGGTGHPEKRALPPLAGWVEQDPMSGELSVHASTSEDSGQ